MAPFARFANWMARENVERSEPYHRRCIEPDILGYYFGLHERFNLRQVKKMGVFPSICDFGGGQSAGLLINLVKNLPEVPGLRRLPGVIFRIEFLGFQDRYHLIGIAAPVNVRRQVISTFE